MPNPSPSYWAVIWRVLRYLRPHRSRLSAGLGLMLSGIVLEVLKPLPLAFVLDCVLGPKPIPAILPATLSRWGPYALLTLAAGAIVCITMLNGMATLGANYLTIDVGQRMVNDLRTQLYAHLQKLSLKFHYKQQTGDLLFRVMSDTFSIQSMVMNGLLPLGGAAITMTAMFSVMVHKDWMLSLVTLLVCPPLFLAISRLSRRIHGHATASREAESALYCRAESTIGAVKLVQAYGREDRAVADFRQGSERSLAISLRLYSTETVFGLVVDSVLAVGTAALVFLGALHVLGQQLSIGDLTIFLAYLLALYKPIQDVSQNLAEVSAARAGLERVFSILDVQPDIRDAPFARPLPPIRGWIRLEHVTFSYDDGSPALKNIDLEFAPAEKIALVGRTGAGKTTLTSLIMRFFDPQQGRVLIDGHDLRDVTLASLRQQITLMLQEPILFHTTVAENIAYGEVNADLARIRDAARRAEAEEFICGLAQGFDTLLGDDGLTLSGGQRQRLALARALLRETPIVILDEPTSSLDTATESLVWRNVHELLKGKTTILIAHRLSTARMANRIVVLRDGELAEQGTHEELLAKQGEYFQLWERHRNGQEPLEDDLILAEPNRLTAP